MAGCPGARHDAEGRVAPHRAGNPIRDVSPLARLTAVRWLMLDAGASHADAALLVPGAGPPLTIEAARGR